MPRIPLNMDARILMHLLSHVNIFCSSVWGGLSPNETLYPRPRHLCSHPLPPAPHRRRAPLMGSPRHSSASSQLRPVHLAAPFPSTSSTLPHNAPPESCRLAQPSADHGRPVPPSLIILPVSRLKLKRRERASVKDAGSYLSTGACRGSRTGRRIVAARG